MDKTLGDQSMEEVHEKDGGEMSRKQPGELAHVVSQEHQRIRVSGREGGLESNRAGFRKVVTG